MLTICCALTVLIFLLIGFHIASKVTPYDSEDYECPSRMASHTNRQDRNDSNNT